MFTNSEICMVQATAPSSIVKEALISKKRETMGGTMPMGIDQLAIRGNYALCEIQRILGQRSLTATRSYLNITNEDIREF